MRNVTDRHAVTVYSTTKPAYAIMLVGQLHRVFATLPPGFFYDTVTILAWVSGENASDVVVALKGVGKLAPLELVAMLETVDGIVDGLINIITYGAIDLTDSGKSN